MRFSQKLKQALLFAAAAFLFGVAASVGFDAAMRIITREKKVVVTPDVTGMNIAKAMDTLQGKGLIARKSKENSPDETLPSGSVIRQSPPSGSVVKKGRAVTLTLSEGGNLIYVPDIKGRKLQEAEILLTRANLSVGDVRGIYNDEFKRDVIISQDPGEGEIVKPEALIDVVVSKGPASLMGFLVMPYLVGKSSAAAADTMNEMGFEVAETEEVINNNMTPGIVIKQEPAPGETLSKDAYVKFYISRLSEEMNIKKKIYIYWEMPQDIKNRILKIVVRDAAGRRKVYEHSEAPGKKISLETETIGSAYAIFYLDDVPVERKDYD